MAEGAKVLRFQYAARRRQVWAAWWLALCWCMASGCAQFRAIVARPPKVSSVAEALAVLRDSRDPAHRQAAYEFLLNPKHFPDGQIPADLLQTVVESGLSEPEAIERVWIVTLLGQIESPEVLEGLLRAADDPDPLVRQAACEQLAQWPSDRTVAVLAERLARDASIDVRLAAARALGQIRSQQAAQALLAHLNDPDIAVRYRVRQALSELVGEDHGFDGQAWQAAIEQASFQSPRRGRWWRWWGR